MSKRSSEWWNKQKYKKKKKQLKESHAAWACMITWSTTPFDLLSDCNQLAIAANTIWSFNSIFVSASCKPDFCNTFIFLHELHLQRPISKNNHSNFLMQWLSVAGSLLFWPSLFEQHSGIQSTCWKLAQDRTVAFFYDERRVSFELTPPVELVKLQNTKITGTKLNPS